MQQTTVPVRGSMPWISIVILVLLRVSGIQARLEACEQKRSFSPLDCELKGYVDKYRSYDGSCNNRQFPLWGASDTPMFRLLSPLYEDGREAPIGFFRTVFYDGFRKPNARDVSRVLMRANFTLVNPYHTTMVTHWGQILAHDFTLAAEGMKNCTAPNRKDPENCFNIPLHPGEIPIRRTHEFPLKRDEGCIGQGGKREQINEVTSYIDASQIYGSNEDSVLRVRDFTRDSGLLRVNEFYRSPIGKDYLPFDEPEIFSNCHRDRRVTGVKCFLSGDRRTTEQPVLTVIHTIFMREHNRIARVFRRLNPHWDGDKIFLETRKLVGAMFQSISYNEWLPKVVGYKGVSLMGPYEGYRPFENPSTSNAFAVAVMRFGHAIIVPEVDRRDPDYRPYHNGHVLLRDAFFAPELIVFDGGIDPIIRGAIFSAAKEITGLSMLNEELTEHLFPHALRFPQDLASRNIQRAREHGVPGYNDYRKFCGLPIIRNWNDMEREMRDPAALPDMRELYKRPDNLDLWVGGLHERPLEGSKLGPTFTCLMVDQFKRSRDGDRFWHERSDQFTYRQLQSIRNYTLAKIICHNADAIDRIQPDVFEQHRILVPCRSLYDLDLNLWRDRSGRGSHKFGPHGPGGFGDGHGPNGLPDFIVRVRRQECRSPECACRYVPGKWGPCDPVSAIETRRDRLKRVNQGGSLHDQALSEKFSCPPYRTVTQKCNEVRAVIAIPPPPPKDPHGHP